MAIKILLFIIGYLFIGWIVDRKMTDPDNPEGLHMTIIVMFTWPFIALEVIYFMIIDAIMNIVDWICERVKTIKWEFRKRKILRYACKTGCDLDGDIVTYKGTKYYVHVCYERVKEV